MKPSNKIISNISDTIKLTEIIQSHLIDQLFGKLLKLIILLKYKYIHDILTLIKNRIIIIKNRIRRIIKKLNIDLSNTLSIYISPYQHQLIVI